MLFTHTNYCFMRNRLLTIIVLFLCSGMSIAQKLSPQVTAMGGNSMINNNVHLDWTLGESVTTTLISGDLSLTQGFHQPLLMTRVGVEDFDQSLELVIYPNPVMDMVTLKSPHDLSFEISNSQGQLVQKQREHQLQSTIDFSGMPPGVYFIHIKREQRIIGVYKIEKINY